MLYEKNQWAEVAPGQFELRERPDWYIGMLLTRHSPECAVAAELRRSQGKNTPDRRLEMAREAACTCGSSERKQMGELTFGQDRRDMSDPAEVGATILKERKNVRRKRTI